MWLYEFKFQITREKIRALHYNDSEIVEILYKFQRVS